MLYFHYLDFSSEMQLVFCLFSLFSPFIQDVSTSPLSSPTAQVPGVLMLISLSVTEHHSFSENDILLPNK